MTGQATLCMIECGELLYATSGATLSSWQAQRAYPRSASRPSGSPCLPACRQVGSDITGQKICAHKAAGLVRGWAAGVAAILGARCMLNSTVEPAAAGPLNARKTPSLTYTMDSTLLACSPRSVNENGKWRPVAVISGIEVLLQDFEQVVGRPPAREHGTGCAMCDP